MKVLYLAPSADRPDRLTAHTFLDEEIRAFRSAGVEAYLLSTSADRDYELDGVRVCTVPPAEWRDRGRTLAFLLRRSAGLPPRFLRDSREAAYLAHLERLAAGLVRRERIDLVHSIFGWPGGLGGALASEAAGVPLIANFRGMDLLVDPSIGYGMRSDPVWDATIRVPLRRADRTLYATDFMRDRGIGLGADPASAVTIHKGVDLERFAPAADRLALRARLGCEVPMVLTVCNLIRRKGVHHILGALARLKDALAFSLVVCGDGPERPALEELAEHLGLGGRVRFAGRVGRGEIADYFAACDVFVLGSLLEAAGNVVLEAMASGRPAICTDSGGPPEYVAEGENGFVVPVGDEEAFADRLGRLLRDPDLGDTMGRLGRAWAAERHPYPRMVRDVLDLYQRTAPSAAPSRSAAPLPV